MNKTLVTIVMLLMSWQAHGSERTSWVNDAGTGQFLMQDTDGHWEPALLLNTDADIEVNGPVAEVTLTQRFSNRARGFTEGIYVFPLPENAAIHGMNMLVGDRRIQGQIHEKQQARKIYEKARESGQRTGIVEQERPNIFTVSVANIAAGERIAVEIRYTQVLERDAARFSLRLPLTITPRYATPDPERYHALDLVKDRQGKLQPGSFSTSIVETATRSALLPEEAQQASLHARINPGLPISSLVSRSHDIHTNRLDDQYDITLAAGHVPMDRDFLLSWEISPRTESTATFFTETVEGEHYGLLMMMPPARGSNATAVHKEQILVIDQSGSMNGTRIAQARESLQHALRRLDAGDRFNVLAFNNHVRTLFPQPVRANRTNIHHAMAFISGLKAGGGTEMLPALKSALSMDSRPGYLRQILFVTDGAIANEHALLDTIHENLGDARLFPVGIGSAPNDFLLRGLARFGRGVHAWIGQPDQVRSEMNRLLDRMARPMLSDIRIELPEGITASFSPRKIPDLYQGEPLVASIRLDRLPEAITVRGRSPEGTWTRNISIESASSSAGVASLWARDRIRTLMDKLVGGADERDIRRQVLDIALQHQLVSRYTSFVAVEQAPIRQPGESLDSEKVANRLPADMTATGNRFPDTALGTDLQFLLAFALALTGLLLLLSSRGTCRHVTA